MVLGGEWEMSEMNSNARKIVNVVLIALGVLVALLFVGWLGLQVKPKPFPAYSETTPVDIRRVSLPDGLPKPVDRYLRLTYGDTVPVIETAVLTGRATIRPAGPITFPSRYRFTHVAGKDYRHYIEACWFGLPVIKVNERYIDGESLMVIPVIGTDKGPKVEWSASQGMWAESWQFPALFVTDPRVKWLPVDDDTVILEVPFKGDQRQQFVVRFDPETGLPTWTETMRYQGSTSAEKVLWMTHALEFRELNGVLTNTVGSATWLDDGKPWATFELEDAQFNVDVAKYVRAEGI